MRHLISFGDWKNIVKREERIIAVSEIKRIAVISLNKNGHTILVGL